MKAYKNAAIKYLVSNSFDELWGMYIATIGFQSIPPNVDYPPQGHPLAYWFKPNSGRWLHEYQLVYITKGEGIFESSSCKPVKVYEGTVILLFPGEWHTYKPVKNIGWDTYWVGFNGGHPDNLCRNSFFLLKTPILNIGYNEQMISLFSQGIEIANSQRTAYQQMLAGITSLLLSIVFYAEKNNAFGDKTIISQIDRARMMMRENTETGLTPMEISKKLNLGYSWFRRVFKQYTGFSPAQYQIEIKIQKAKELLTSTDMPIKEISFELNFESISYFVTFFKSKTTMTPTEFRNKVRGGKGE